MSATNIAILSASVVLQLLLLVLLFTRRIASQLHLFTVLVGFYVVRSVLLVVLFRWVSTESYVQTYTVLSAVDVLLQIALAFEFSLLIVRGGERPYLPRTLLAPMVFLIAAAVASGITALLPAHSRAPVDRVGIFTGVLFIGLLVWSIRVPLARWQRSALTGLAGMGAAGIAAQVGRTLAAIHQDAHAYRLWSYSNAVVYLITLVVWIAHCKPVADSTAIRQARIGVVEEDSSTRRGTLSLQRPL